LRRRRKKRVIAILAVYVALWIATAVWGPAAMVARQRGSEDAYSGSMGLDPEERRKRLHEFVVPAPFVVLAEWESGSTARPRSNYSQGDQWGVWLPGRFWVVRDRMTLVACGIMPPAEPGGAPHPRPAGPGQQ
jgi:hypothetical protein